MKGQNNKETIKSIENILSDFTSRSLKNLFLQSFVSGHNWDYDVTLVRTILLDKYEKLEGAAAVKSLQALALDK